MSRERSATRDQFTPGLRIGDYRVERELRSDDTGIIYEAVHLVLPRRAALKVTHPSSMYIRSVAIQMMREACVLEALAHPGVPRIYECGMLPDKRPWVARELIAGTTVTELMQTGSMGMSELVVLLRSVAEIIDHAHGRGVVHYQLGEASIVRTPTRTFPYCVRGWASVVVHDTENGVDPSVDVQSLGALAFRGLTGTTLLPNASAQEQASAAPVELTSLIDQMLSPIPSARPTAAEVRERAAWLAQTLELLPEMNPRWTPPHGLQDRTSAERDSVNDFTIRIHT